MLVGIGGTSSAPRFFFFEKSADKDKERRRLFLGAGAEGASFAAIGATGGFMAWGGFDDFEGSAATGKPEAFSGARGGVSRGTGCDLATG
jgi:hypothetical protein